MEILALVRNSFSPSAIRRTASFLGEEEAKVRRGLQETIPAVLAQLINRTTVGGSPSATGAAFLTRLLARGSHDGNLLDEIGNILSNPRSAQAVVSLGERAAEGIFGTLSEPVRKAIAEDCGMSADSTAHLLSLTSLVSLEVLANQVAVKQLPAQAVMEELHAQRRTVARALPAEVARFIEFYEKAALEQTVVIVETPVQRWKLRLLRLLA